MAKEYDFTVTAFLVENQETVKILKRVNVRTSRKGLVDVMQELSDEFAHVPHRVTKQMRYLVDKRCPGYWSISDIWGGQG